MDHPTARPRLVCIPSSDSGLRARAGEVLHALPADLGGEGARREFERRLREHYPHAVARPQEELASIGGPPVWYVTDRSFGTRFSVHTDVPADPERTFRVYVEQVEEWQTALRLRRVPAATASDGLVGREYQVAWRLLGLAFEGRLRLVGADQPRWVRYEAEGGGIRLWYVTSFRPTEGGTALDVAGDYDLPNAILATVADRFGLDRAIGRQIDDAHASLAALLSRSEADITGDRGHDAPEPGAGIDVSASPSPDGSLR